MICKALLFFLSLAPYLTSIDHEEQVQTEVVAPTIDNYESKLYTMIFYSSCALIVAFIITYYIRKISSQNFQSLNAHNNLKIIERRSLSPKSVLYLVQLGDSKYIVSESHVDVSIHKE